MKAALMAVMVSVGIISSLPARAEEPARELSPAAERDAESGDAESGGAEPVDPEQPQKIRSRHKWLGIASLPVIGLQIGTGIGLALQQPNPDISLRQIHMLSTFALAGLSLSYLNDAIGAKTEPRNRWHRILGYASIGLMTLNAAVGIARARAWDRTSDAARAAGVVHTSLGVLSAGALVGAAFTVSWD